MYYVVHELFESIQIKLGDQHLKPINKIQDLHINFAYGLWGGVCVCEVSESFQPHRKDDVCIGQK